jgi:predicted nucleic acid-binding protein
LTTHERTLIDTGVLLRAFDATFREYRVIRRGLRKALDQQRPLVVAIQNLAEFWNVATRPLDNNGYGLSIERVKRRLAIIEQICDLVAEDRTSFQEWKRMVEKLGVSGVAVHDARLVSVMQRSGIHQILTLNPSDFQRYGGEGIIVLTPQDYLNLCEEA